MNNRNIYYNIINMSMNNNNQYIIVYFSYNTIIALKVNIKAKISILIEAYKKTLSISDQNLEFYYNGKVLNPNLSVEEAGIQNNSKIYVQKKNVQRNGRVLEYLPLSYNKNNGRVDECYIMPINKNNHIANNCLNIPNNTKNDRIAECAISPYNRNDANNMNKANIVYNQNNINIHIPQPEKIINIKFIKQPDYNQYNLYNPYLNIELYGLLKLCLLKEISPKLNDYENFKKWIY